MGEYSEKLEDLLDHQLIANEDLKKKKEGGGVGYLLNGNMCLGIFEDLLVARIGASLAKTLATKPGIRKYLPDKGLYDDFILVEESIYSHSKALKKFVERSLDYTSGLPPKDHGKTKHRNR